MHITIIPLLALSIPIVAIIYAYKLMKLKIESKQKGAEKTVQLEERIIQLEETVANLNDGVKQLEDKNRFMTKLLDEK